MDKHKKSVVFVRHGETEWNVKQRLQGHKNTPLTREGIKRIEALAHRLSTYDFDAVYSSDQLRAVETARLLLHKSQIEIIKDERLRERSFGILEGLNRDEIKQKHPEIWERMNARDPAYNFPEGETGNHFYNRTVAFFEEIAAHEHQNILVVSHGGVLTMLVRYIMKLSVEAPRHFAVPNAAFNRFTYADNVWMIETLGDLSHDENH